MKIGIDDGHGLKDPTNTKENPGKRTPLFPNGHYVLEDIFNKGAAKFFEIACKRQGFEVLQLAPEDYNVSLDERVRRANAWRCEYIVSFHFDFVGEDGIWNDRVSGYTVFYQLGCTDGQKLAECIAKRMSGGTPQKNRGARPNDLEITRETKGTAVLIECGFMSNHYEAGLMELESFQKECAEEVCAGLCDYIGVTYIPEEENKLKKIVLYLGDADLFPAIPVSQEFHCPIMKKSDFEEQGLNADEIIQIGGKPGSDRKSTFKDAANLI